MKAFFIDFGLGDKNEGYKEPEERKESEYDLWLKEQRALPEEKPSGWFATQKEIFMSLCNDNSLLFRWMHLLFPICQDRINLMIRYAQYSHLFICSQQE